MGAARKLTQEIDRTLKKVQEGLDQFDEIWIKVYEGDIHHQKDKLEGDLKKEIKKLQRHRDQIKTWVASNDVKDKTELTEARRKIERQMEKFKECEKEMKTKAFSKEGLGRMQKVEPRELAKNERIEWLNAKVDELGTRVEMNESEQETLLSNLGKKKEPPARVRELAERNARYKKHVERLEQILRALDNETIQYEQVDDIKELFDDYMENNEDDEDGVYTDVDSIYMELLEILDNIEVHVPIVVEKPVAKAAAAAAAATAAGPDPKKTKAEKDAEREKERMRLERERERATVQAARAQLAGQGKKCALLIGHTGSLSVPHPVAAMDTGDDSKTAKAVAMPSMAADRSMSASLKAIPKEPPLPPPIRQPPQPAAPQGMPSASVLLRADSTTDSTTSLHSSLPQPTAAPPASGGQAPIQPNHPVAWGMAADAQDDTESNATANVAETPHTPPDTLPGGFAPFTGTTLGPSMEASGFVAPALATADSPPPTNPSSYLDILHACMHTGHAIPLPHDGAWGVPRCAVKGNRPHYMPASYPLQPPPVLDLPGMWENITEVEDLFTAFYLTPGTNCQYFAARELKRRNWRFHKQLGAWFQRHHDPRESTDEYENGDYIYFDHKLSDSGEGWVFRMKQAFVFRYDQLEKN